MVKNRQLKGGRKGPFGLLLALAARKQDRREAVPPNSQLKVRKLLNLSGLGFLVFREVTVLPTSQGRWPVP